jgi:hypothetical protein
MKWRKVARKSQISFTFNAECRASSGVQKLTFFLTFFHFEQAKRCIATVKTERSQLANGAHGP